MKEFLRRLWVVFRKEMTHCYRDPHVVIYGVLFPLLFYPAAAIAMLEIGIFQEGKRESEVYRIVFPESKEPNVAAIREMLSKSKRGKLVTSPNPDKDLKDGNIEAIVEESGGNLSVKVAGSLPLSEAAHTYISKFVESRRFKNLRKELTDKNVPLEIMRVFTFELKDSKTPKTQKEESAGGEAAHVIFRYILASVICVLVLCIPAGAVYPAICAFTEEREKKTLESTLVAPVSTECLMTGKFLSVFFVALMSGLLNLIGMSLVIWLMVSQAKELSSLSKLSGSTFSVSFETGAALVSATVLFSLLVSAIFSLLGAMTKSFKEAQNMLTVPLLIFTPMPIAGMLPGVLLSKTLAFVPVLNLILWVKAAVRGDADIVLVQIAVGETLLLVALMLFLLNRLIRTEKFVLGDQIDLWTPFLQEGKPMTVEVKDLKKMFFDPKRGEFLAVDGISFNCSQGEIVGLLGPNGAGKTTTLRMIATILRPDSGTAKVNGFEITADPQSVRKNLGFLSSETGLYERLTPREILNYFGQLSDYPLDKLEQRIEDLIKLFEMKEFADTRCERLSTGMKQKVSIARAIVHDPPVMALDEPTSGLDIITSQNTYQFIRDSKAQGKCIIFSTHIMSEAEKLCDRIGIIHRGKLFAMGTLEELRQLTGAHYLEDIFLAIVKEAVDV